MNTVIRCKTNRTGFGKPINELNMKGRFKYFINTVTLIKRYFLFCTVFLSFGTIHCNSLYCSINIIKTERNNRYQ